MKALNFVKTAVWIAFLTGISAAGIMHVAVVETEVDIHSGAADKLTKAEVRLVTAELRREAVNNLPRNKYNIMTSETVMAQGSAKLEECAEENCVIALGAKIGADYIVRGIISRLQTRLTLTVEIYETENGNLVASSDPVRSEKVGELIEKAAAACASMYKKFANEQNATPQSSTPQQTPKQSATYTVTVNINPTNGGYVSRSSNKTYYDAGEMLTLTATPYNGYAFTGWSGASTSTKATLKGPVTGDLKLTANFQYIQQAYTPAPNDYSPSFGSVDVDSDPQQTYTLTTNVFPTDWGTVTRNPNKSAYTNGETVTVTATAYNGCTFAGWTGETKDKANREVVIIMDGNKALTANFHGQRVGSSSMDAAKNEDKQGYYINVIMPLFASPPLAGEWLNLEGGWFGTDKLAYGFEFGGGFFGNAHNTSNILAGVGRKESIGGGFNISRMSKRWILGLSAGYWYGRFELESYSPELQIVHTFGGPFVKLRCWRVCEFAYRGLMGYKQEGSYYPLISEFVADSEKKFTWASQFKFGLHFEIAHGSTQH